MKDSSDNALGDVLKVQRLKKLSKKQLVMIVAAGCLLFYAVGVLTNLFGSAIFSVLFIISKEVAIDLAYLSMVVAVALITLPLAIGHFKKPRMVAKADFVDQSVDKNSGVIEDQQDSSVNNVKAALRGNELLKAINASIGIVDLSFDILIGLQNKRIDWQQLEDYTDGLGEKLNFTAESIPHLNLDFSKFSLAIKGQIPRETAKEAYNILAAVHGYFRGLRLDNEIEGSLPNFREAKALVSAYFMLNDLWLGKVAGDNENEKEKSQLETVLQNLAEKGNFKVNFQALWGCLDKTCPMIDIASVIEESRGIFKEQLKVLQPNAISPQVE